MIDSKLQSSTLPTQPTKNAGDDEVQEDEQMLTDKSDELTSMTLDQKKELLNKYCFLDNLKVGDHLDAQDSTNDFILSTVVAMSATQCTVHFDGWSDRWNMVSEISFGSNKCCRLTA